MGVSVDSRAECGSFLPILPIFVTYRFLGDHNLNHFNLMTKQESMRDDSFLKGLKLFKKMKNPGHR